jgi:hypothetical protein
MHYAWPQHGYKLFLELNWKFGTKYFWGQRRQPMSLLEFEFRRQSLFLQTELRWSKIKYLKPQIKPWCNALVGWSAREKGGLGGVRGGNQQYTVCVQHNRLPCLLSRVIKNN